MDVTDISVSAHTLSGVPFDERWEILRPVITQLYVMENVKLPNLRDILRQQYDFDASESQYKYQISKKWKLLKNIPSAKKAAMVDMRLARSAEGNHTTFKYKGQIVDNKVLRRHIKDSTRRQMKIKAETQFAQSNTSISSEASKMQDGHAVRWNMPYGAMRAAGSRDLDHYSPFAAVSTPSDIALATPPSNHAASPQGIQSPFSRALEKKFTMNRTHLFLEGKHTELMKSMNKSERFIASNWLYQFWLFSFKTAKNWGRGPRRWTAEDLAFERFTEIPSISNVNTPRNEIDIYDGEQTSPNDNNRSERIRYAKRPSDLCRWSIHTNEVVMDDTDVTDDTSFEGFQVNDPHDEASWSDWPRSGCQQNLPDVLRNGLESNDFSNLKADILPMAVSEVLKMTPRAPEDMLREAFAFSIMGRNNELVEDLTKRMIKSHTNFNDLYPFHLATTYLDGSKTCCNILDEVMGNFRFKDVLPPKINELGHTILDNLMVTVIRSHTTCSPGAIDHAWAKDSRFPGEEIDICGRWDADSACFRELLAEGSTTIPSNWKHKFCHTSAQTIVHCMMTVSKHSSWIISGPSGLFVKWCVSCGLKLEVYPLHSIVLTSFLLAQYGIEKEDLFGMLAVLLCMLSIGADPRRQVPVSLTALLGEEQIDQCDHEVLDPRELATRIQSRFAHSWSKDVAIGWQILICVLTRSQQQWDPQLKGSYRRQRQPASSADFTGLNSGLPVVSEGPRRSIEPLEEMDVDQSGAEDEEDNASDGSWIFDLEKDADCSYGLDFGEHENYFGKERILGELWAAVRTEMLTYRRATVESSWYSSNFDMHSVYESLTRNELLQIGLVEKGLMQYHCRCGFFEDDYFGCVTMEDVSASYFANLDDWSRITVIAMPPRIRGWER